MTDITLKSTADFIYIKALLSFSWCYVGKKPCSPLYLVCILCWLPKSQNDSFCFKTHKTTFFPSKLNLDTTNVNDRLYPLLTLKLKTRQEASFTCSSSAACRYSLNICKTHWYHYLILAIQLTGSCREITAFLCPASSWYTKNLQWINITRQETEEHTQESRLQVFLLSTILLLKKICKTSTENIMREVKNCYHQKSHICITFPFPQLNLLLSPLVS